MTPVLFGWPDQGLMIDVAVHVGTLGAVIAYLWREVWMILGGMAKLLTGRIDEGARLAELVIVASIPVIIAGFLVKMYLGDAMRTPEVMGWTFIGFGILLYLGDRSGLTIRRIEHLTVSNAFLIGIAQAFAIIPGTSRAGVTITMARLLGFERRDAARFSMLLSIPAIAGAGLLLGMDLVKSDDAALQSTAVFAAALSFVTAFVAILAMMRWLRKQSYTPFVIYRILFGILILWLVA